MGLVDAKFEITGFEDRERVANKSGSDRAVGPSEVADLGGVSEPLGFFSPWVVSIRRTVGGR